MPSSLLLVAPEDRATGRYIRDAFMAEGWLVSSWDYREYAAQLAYQGNAPETINGAVGQRFIHNVDALKCDLVLVLKGEAIAPAALAEAQGRHKIALWHFDPWQAQEPWVVERARAVGHFLTIAKGLVPWYKDQGVNAAWLSEGCDPEVHKPYPATSIQYPVSFIGTVAGVPGREEWLAEIGRALPGNLHIFGSFPAAVPSVGQVRYHGRAEPGDEGLARVVSESGINLGRDRHPEIERSYGARLYRTLAAGGFLLTNQTAGIEEDFRGCLDTYDSTESCVERIRYHGAHPEGRAKMAERGRALVLAKHTFRHRVRELVRMVGL